VSHRSSLVVCIREKQVFLGACMLRVGGVGGYKLTKWEKQESNPAKICKKWNFDKI